MRKVKKNTVTNTLYPTLQIFLKSYSTMPITTRTIAKGVPPRVHKPKGKAKQQTKQAHTSRKRVASESEGEELEDETEPRAKKKRNTTHRQIEESESEVELIEENAQPPEEEVESVDETRGSEEVPDEQEVSTGHLFERDTHQYL